MKLVALRTERGARVAEQRDGCFLDLGPGDVGALLRSEESPSPGRQIGDVTGFLPPLVPGKIVCVGLNYARHVEEAGREVPKRPVVFAKWPSAIVAADDPIIIDPRLTSAVDWEGELGVIVGTSLSHATKAEATKAVYGYTVANDVTARDVQRADGQWTRAKSFDTFGPLGPAVVTSDELEDVADLTIRTRVNGELVQDGRTSDMLFDVAELLMFCSRSFPLRPGDVVLTGTPAGCGAFMDPPRWLTDGDEVEVEIERIGVLRNPVTVVQPAESEGDPDAIG
jgi:2-keto-4-pentenoate hydratase/2-oxohepta-3-ene-1,7-dioic acid hydratase in catechol pathway